MKVQPPDPEPSAAEPSAAEPPQSEPDDAGEASLPVDVSQLSEEELANVMRNALAPLADAPAMRRMKIRLGDMGDNVLDEVQQFRQLQKFARMEPDLNNALIAAGLPDVTTLSVLPPTPEVGQLVQAFNRLVEDGFGPTGAS